MLLKFLMETDCTYNEVMDTMRALLEAGQAVMATKEEKSPLMEALLQMDSHELEGFYSECCVEAAAALFEDEDEDDEFYDGEEFDEDDEDEIEDDAFEISDVVCSVKTCRCDDSECAVIDMGNYIIRATPMEFAVTPKEGFDFDSCMESPEE